MRANGKAHSHKCLPFFEEDINACKVNFGRLGRNSTLRLVLWRKLEKEYALFNGTEGVKVIRIQKLGQERTDKGVPREALFQIFMSFENI
jgi:hypothetical protein